MHSGMHDSCVSTTQKQRMRESCGIGSDLYVPPSYLLPRTSHAGRMCRRTSRGTIPCAVCCVLCAVLCCDELMPITHHHHHRASVVTNSN
jgi:hypothetical protein